MANILENLVIMIFTVLLLIGGGYLALVILNWGLKFKGGMREDEGLVQLWAEAKKEQQASAPSDDTPDDGQP